MLILLVKWSWSHCRVATHQKVKNSLTFHWLFPDLWTVFTDLLLMRNNWCNIWYFSLHQLLSTSRGKRKKKFGQKDSQWKALTTTTTRVLCSVWNWSLFLLCSTPLIFSERNAFQNLEENLWTINWKTEFPDFSLTLSISEFSPNFLKNSLTFPLPWKIFVFPCQWLFPDCSNPVLGLEGLKH